MPILFQDTKINHDRDQLIFQCIQQLLDDSSEIVTMNYFETSAPYLMELFGNRTLHIYALNEDNANKELIINLFLIDKSDCNKATHYRKRIPASYAESHQWLAQGEETEFSVFDTPSDLKNLFNLDFGTLPIIMHHLWFKNRIVGGVAYSSDNVNSDTNNFDPILPILNVLTSQLSQRQNYIELKVQLKTFKQVINLIPQRVFWKNKKSIYLGANTAFSMDAGIKNPEDIIGKSDADLFPNEADNYQADDKHTMKTRKHLLNFEEQQTNNKGKKIWLRTSKRPMENSLDEVVGTVGTYDEITELKDIQLELQKSKDGLEDNINERTLDLISSNHKLKKTLKELKKTQNHLIETEKMAALGNLVAGISHEINTPIGVSVTAASHLQETIESLQEAFSSEQLTEEHFAKFCITAKESSQILLNNLTRASNLIKDFKQVAIDQSHDKPRKVRLKKYVSSILTTLTPVFKNKNIELEVDIEHNLQLIIYPGILAQIVTNFTENAIKHAFPEKEGIGKFRISCYLTNHDIRLHFVDNGVGVPLNLQKKIFEPFFTTKEKSGGSGLGLSIIYNIICQQFKGKIECKSNLGGGTKFCITIPKQANVALYK